MAKILIVYATREGQTEKVARQIYRHLTDQDHQVSLFNAIDSQADKVMVDAIDLLVFGASMHAGGLEPELVNFVTHRAGGIATKNRSFFLVLLSAAARDPELREKWLADARAKMSDQLPLDFSDSEFIAGALTYSKYPWPLKWFMKRIARQAGEETEVSKDYEYTDWDQVKRYCDRLAQMVA